MVYKVCIVGISGLLGQYMTQHCLDRGYEVVGVCREESVHKLDRFKGNVTVYPGNTNDREIVRKAVKDCNGVLTVLMPWGVQQYSSTTAQAVLDFAEPEARLIFSCGWHISKDKQDQYSWGFLMFLSAFGWIGKLFGIAELSDQVTACDNIFASNKKWTVVRGSDLEEGESQGLPAWSRHVQDPILASNITRRIDFALFMVEALKCDGLIHEAPAIVSCRAPSACAQKN